MADGAETALAALAVTGPRKVVIDTDPGVDDALALLLALGSAETLQVQGITVVQGNNPDAKMLGANAKLILRLAGFEGVSVSLGVSTTEGAPAPHMPVMVHGEDGLGNAAERYGRCAEDFTDFHHLPAHEFIYQECARAPEQVTLICIGPLTNIARAVSAHPDLPQLVQEVVVMGGSFGEPFGNRTPTAEANFVEDPEAAQAVLTGGFRNIVLAGLNITHQTDIAALCEACEPQRTQISRFIWDVCQNYIEVCCSRWSWPTAAAHDIVAVMYLIHPELFTKVHVRVEVELCGSLTRGMSVADWRGQWGRPANCDVLQKVDAEAFKEAFAKAIARLTAVKAGVITSTQ